MTYIAVGRALSPAKRVFQRFLRFLLTICFSALIPIFVPSVFSQSIIKDDFRVNYDTTAIQSSPDIDVDSSSNFVVVWESQKNSDYNIYAQRFNSIGQPLNTNFLVNDNTSGNQKNPSLAKSSNGNFIIVWQDLRNGNYDIYAQKYDPSGGKIGSNFKVNDNPGNSSQQEPACDFHSKLVICWQDEREGNLDIFQQLYNSLGAKIDSNLRVCEKSDSTQWRPSVAMDTSGNFIVVWQDKRNGNYDIYGQRFNSSGNFLGNNFRINDDPTSFQQNFPKVASENQGNFIVVWQDQRNGDYDIYAQRYDYSGVKLDVNFRVNDDVGNYYQGQPDVGMDGSGSFVVVWKDKREGSDDIYAQRYSFSGSAEGKNYKVNNSSTSSERSQPAVATNREKIFFVWKNSSSNNCDIVAKIVEWDWTEVEEKEENFSLPNDFVLGQNYPNPFNGHTTIPYHFSCKLQDASRKTPIHTTLTIYNILGQRVRTLVDEEKLPGEYKVIWDGRDDKGDEISSGIYFYKLKTEELFPNKTICTETKRMILLK